MNWHLSSRYGHEILVSGYPVLTAVNWIVNVQCKICGLAKTPLWHPSLPLDSLPYPTRTIRRRVPTYVRTYLRTLGQSRDNQTKIGWPYSMSMGLCRARGSPAIKAYSRPILRVCQSLWDSFLYLGKLHWFLYLLLSYFYDPGMFIFRWSSNFVEKVVLNESMSAKMASRVSYLAYYCPRRDFVQRRNPEEAP